MAKNPTEQKWLVAARELVGLKEIVGSGHEGKVLRFYAEAGHAWVKDDETAWCAAFANAMLARAGIKGTNSLAARSFLQWGKKLAKPEVGCIAVFERGSSKWQGHVAFFLREVGSKVEVLGGNQGNAVSIAMYPKSSLLGYRWPSEGAVAAKVPAAPKLPPPSRDYTEAAIKDVQRKLLAHGYVKVGGIDGEVGDNTKSAIRDFRAKNDLPEGDHIDKAFLAKLAKPTAVRPVIAPERANATAGDLRKQGSEIISASRLTKIGTAAGGALTVGGPVLDALTDSDQVTVVTETGEAVTVAPEKLGPLIDALTETGEGVTVFTEKLEPFQAFLAFLGDWMWVGAIVIFLFIAFFAYRITKARVRDHRLGNTAVVNLPAEVA